MEINHSSFYGDGEMSLSIHHSYYDQVQGQLEVCDKSYCDFICWSTKGIHIERIYRNPSFFKTLKPTLDHFSKQALLPRILCGSDFDCNKENVDVHANEEEVEPLYCFCQQPEFGKMIGCDNDFCQYEWFHYPCVGIKRKPRGRWYCSEECRVADGQLLC